MMFPALRGTEQEIRQAKAVRARRADEFEQLFERVDRLVAYTLAHGHDEEGQALIAGRKFLVAAREWILSRDAAVFFIQSGGEPADRLLARHLTNEGRRVLRLMFEAVDRVVALMGDTGDGSTGRAADPLPAPDEGETDEGETGVVGATA